MPSTARPPKSITNWPALLVLELHEVGIPFCLISSMFAGVTVRIADTSASAIGVVPSGPYTVPENAGCFRESSYTPAEAVRVSPVRARRTFFTVPVSTSKRYIFEAPREFELFGIVVS